MNLIFSTLRCSRHFASSCSRAGFVLGLLLSTGLASGAFAARTLPANFQAIDVITGLSYPTVVEFAPDGRVFVAEKSGIIKVYDGLGDPSPDIFADLRLNVLNFVDRGLLGMVLHPEFPAKPYVYVLYAADLNVSQAENDQQNYPPKWGDAVPQDSDLCPDPPGLNASSGGAGGCVGAGRISRLQASQTSNQMVGDELILVQDFFQQFPSHSVGALEFGVDGYLYASIGDGASFDDLDTGQFDSDVPPPMPPETFPDDPVGEGGALRSQDLETAGDANGLDGTILRIDPITGAGAPGNPLAASADPNRKRIVAYGLRNPFRFAFQNGTRNLFIADVGWNNWEEINYLPNAGNSLRNFGWPCYEGVGTALYKDQPICLRHRGKPSPLAGSPFVAATDPIVSYSHTDGLSGQCAGNGDASPSAVVHYPGGNYPSSYNGRVFFGDYSRGCIWTLRNSGGWDVQDFMSSTPNERIVDLTVGPGGDLYYVEIDRGVVVHLRYGSNLLPTAVITLRNGSTQDGGPRTVYFDGTQSLDPDGDIASYAWDLDGDGQFDDSTQSQPSRNYSTVGTFLVRLRVTDADEATSVTTFPIYTDNGAPEPVLITPASDTLWVNGQSLSYSGSATDLQDGSIPGACPGGGNSQLLWTLRQAHCFDLSSPASCHTHTVFANLPTTSGTTGGLSHPWPSELEFELKAIDCDGRSTTVMRTIEMSIRFTDGLESGNLNAWSSNVP